MMNGTRKTKAQILASVGNVAASKIVARNTVRYTTTDGETRVRLHSTDVVTTHKNGTVTLNNGGWNTVTTRDRINRFSPFRVYTSKGVATVHTDAGAFPFPGKMTFKPNGEPVNLRSIKAAVKRAAKLRAKIKAFADRIKTMESVPMPSPGDCWLCAIDSGTGDAGHLESHVSESYLHGGLIVLALRSRGFPDTRIAMDLNNGNPSKRDRTHIARNLAWFLYQRLGV